MSTTPTWSPGSGTGSFTPPRTTPAEPVSTKRERGMKRPSPRMRDRVVMAVLAVVVVALVVAAGGLVWKALTPVDASAPVPEVEFEMPQGKPTGPTGEQPVAMDGGGQMTVADMAPNTLFIPALGVYMPLENDATFVDSRYSNFETLKVPVNARKAVHYAAGAPLVGGDAGTTLIAGHVSTASGWGALRYLYTLKGGELIYTADATGSKQEWQLTRMRVEQHTDFPQEYWSAEGDRQLVITTCGGQMTSGRHFLKNIFAIATPVNPAPAPTDASNAEAGSA
ncbi:class F sortase [Microbacterium sp. SL62]|uniref:class F sortase n=1 Tax=Microbacterium sp. SL62 TaxID=2995139 RepID=UPI0022766F24|nr:class F sortase [Microbacterium sp. SL62]MCY1718428.1 class F sortase [Microbacterium sp. SL62]